MTKDCYGDEKLMENWQEKRGNSYGRKNAENHIDKMLKMDYIHEVCNAPALGSWRTPART